MQNLSYHPKILNLRLQFNQTSKCPLKSLGSFHSHSFISFLSSGNVLLYLYLKRCLFRASDSSHLLLIQVTGQMSPLWRRPLFCSNRSSSLSHATLPCIQFSSVQSLSRVRLFATPWIAARQASLSITNSRRSLRLTSIKSVISSSHLILARPLLLLPPIPPSIRVFSNKSALHMR